MHPGRHELPSQAKSNVQDRSDLAKQADLATSDGGEIFALEGAWRAVQQLLAHGVPASHPDGVLELAEQLGSAFLEFPEEL